MSHRSAPAYGDGTDVGVAPAPVRGRGPLGAARRLIALSAALLAFALVVAPRAFGLNENSFAGKAETRTNVAVSEAQLRWEAVDPTGMYLLMRVLPRREPEYALVKGTRATPPQILGRTVSYRVRPVTGMAWSAEVSISYPQLGLETGGILGQLSESDFVQPAESRPIATVSRETLQWEPVDPTGAYLLRRTLPGQESEYAVVKSTRARPPAMPGETVGYRVKAVTGNTWSPEVSISYTEEPSPEEEVEEEAPAGETGSLVKSKPTGPATPAGGWYVAFADGFGAPLGTGPRRDNFWYPNRFCCNPASNQKGFNADELEVFNSSQVRVGSQGLELVDTYQPNVGGVGKNYVSGTVNSDLAGGAGYRPFTFTPGRGVTFAFECVCKLPRNTGEEDPGWWSSDPRWTDEIDFFEFWGWNLWAKYNMGVSWIWKTPSNIIESEHDLGQEFNPSAAFHRYTTVLNANNTIEEFIDGVRQNWIGHRGVLGPVSSPTVVPMGLILSLGLRGTGLRFTSGSRILGVRSVAVYEDARHAGEAVNGGGIAPGTVLE
jgi:Glycosyl hydrolases family 16